MKRWSDALDEMEKVAKKKKRPADKSKQSTCSPAEIFGDVDPKHFDQVSAYSELEAKYAELEQAHKIEVNENAVLRAILDEIKKQIAQVM